MIMILNLFDVYVYQDYSYSLQTLYWIDTDVKSIFSSSLSGFAQKTKVVSDLIGVEDLAVDWIHNIIYWTDSKRVAISACSTGNFSKVTNIQGLHIRYYYDFHCRWSKWYCRHLEKEFAETSVNSSCAY